jgi:hypothetical protein
MLTIASPGIRAEGVFRRCLRRARIEQVEARFEPRFLVGTALSYGDRRLQQVLKHHNVGCMTAAQLLDHVYGLDHVIDVGEGVLVGIDITLNHAKLADKVRKAADLRKLTSKIGIQAVCVIHLVGDIDHPDTDVIDASIESFWDELTDRLNGNGSSVSCFRFHIS